jgi:methylated-DNA-protein-cysteine methyltransferase-like protein
VTPSGSDKPKDAAAASRERLERIWRVVARLPKGTVSTYGGVAVKAGLPRGARRVGRALRVAPKSLELPWHRVTGAGGRIVFARGSRHFREQRRRLEAEGVEVVRGRVRLPRAATLDALLWGSGR